ncbi:MAG: hypothetical protein M3Q48_03925, partial [Actinomycetota bacterium]|nr:hypothetical protein [Actinomycetota bacterium]
MVAVGAAMLASVPSSSADTSAVKGSAFGYHADEISLFGGAQPDTGPTPTVALAADASNSPQTATESTGFAQYGPATLFSSDRIDVSSSGSLGPTGSVTSSTSIQNVNKATTQPTTGSEILTADTVASTCTASASSPTPTGATTLTNATLQLDSGFNDGDAVYPEPGEHDAEVIALPTTPAPGTSHDGHIHLSATSRDDFRVVLNEQVTNADGSLTVNAVHEYFGTTPTSVLKGHLILGQAVCGVTVTAPTTTTTAPTTTTTTTAPTTTTTTTAPTTTTTTTAPTTTTTTAPTTTTTTAPTTTTTTAPTTTTTTAPTTTT